MYFCSLDCSGETSVALFFSSDVWTHNALYIIEKHIVRNKSLTELLTDKKMDHFVALIYLWCSRAQKYCCRYFVLKF